MNRIKYLLLGRPAAYKTAITAIFSLFIPSVHAALLPGVVTPTIQGFVQGFLCQIAVWMFYILIGLSVIYVIWAAYRYLTSAGEEEKIRTANRTLTYAAIAIAVALVAKAFPLIIVSVFPSAVGQVTQANTCL